MKATPCADATNAVEALALTSTGPTKRRSKPFNGTNGDVASDGVSDKATAVEPSYHTVAEAAVVDWARGRRRDAGKPVAATNMFALKIDRTGMSWDVDDFGLLKCCVCVEGRRPHACKCVCHDFHLSHTVSRQVTVSFRPKCNDGADSDDDNVIRVRLVPAEDGTPLPVNPSALNNKTLKSALMAPSSTTASAASASDPLAALRHSITNPTRHRRTQSNACRLCKSKEHSMRDCPKNNGRPGGYICSFCKQPGHNARGCRQRQAYRLRLAEASKQ